MAARAQKEATRQQYMIHELTKRGVVYRTALDRYGDTRTGWWQDGVWLGSNHRTAFRELAITLELLAAQIPQPAQPAGERHSEHPQRTTRNQARTS